jgi:hypothetical protein
MTMVAWAATSAVSSTRAVDGSIQAFRVRGARLGRRARQAAHGHHRVAGLLRQAQLGEPGAVAERGLGAAGIGRRRL